MKRFLMLAGVAGLVVGACGSGDSAVSLVSIDPAAPALDDFGPGCHDDSGAARHDC
jgi:hypothetical protein